MLRTSLIFLLLALGLIWVADIAISTGDPWQELGRMGAGAISPDFSILPEIGRALVNTISFALIGIVLAVVMGAVLSLYFDHTPVRLFSAFIRAIHELFWAFLFMPMVGLSSICGILAIAIPYSGVFAKVYAEIRQETEGIPAEAVAASRVSRFIYTTLPAIYGECKKYTSYRFECALRSSAILGFIGLPTLGYHLETAFREGSYGEASAMLYIFYLLILSLKLWARARFIIIPVLAAVVVIDWSFSLSWDNVVRFVTYDILPWPMRAAGFYDGSQTITFDWWGTLLWTKELILGEGFRAIGNTMILTQIALVGSALFTLTLFPLASKRFFGSGVRGGSHLLFIIGRTTPEYVIAYILLQLFGPSMLPAILGLIIHNGSILAALTAGNVNHLSLPFDSSGKHLNRYWYEVLPRCYGQFLAFLFYRWEVIMRESAILGILGVYTLGFFIDSAMSEDHLDVALFFILLTAMLNITLDTVSQHIRRTMRISVKISGLHSQSG